MKPVTASSVHDQNVSRYRPLQNKGPVMKSWTRGAAWVLAVWSCSRILLTMVGVLVRQWTGHHNDFGLDPSYQWLDIWGEWDTGWYLSIATSGYSAARSADGLAGGYANYAFFPLYPWLTGITADLVGIPTYIAGLVVSNMAILLGAVVLYRLLELERSTATARRGVLFLFLFPTSYVLSCMMTESLFLSLTIASWYFARRGVWPLSCAFAGLSAMTRSFGVLLGPFLLWEYLRQRQCRLKALNSFQSIFSILRSLDLRILWFALIPAGLAVFMWVCWQVTDNPLAFIEIQDAWRGDQNKYSNPLAVIAWGLARIGTYSDIRQAIWAYGKVFGALTAIATAAVVIHGRRRIDSALTIWSLTTILLYLCTGNVVLDSMQRYLVMIFPQYMILAQYRFGKLSLFIISCTGALIQAITMSFWTNGFHFAV